MEVLAVKENRKSFYSISEAAKIKGINDEELCRRIREENIPMKRIGMRWMIPADGVFEDETEEKNTEEDQRSRGEFYLQQIRAELLEILEAAPEFGSCGIVITLHDGKITKINKQQEITKRG